jgi:hypothetical protein
MEITIKTSINELGDCQKCDSVVKIPNTLNLGEIYFWYCIAFKQFLLTDETKKYKPIQCDKCKKFIHYNNKQVYCRDCIHFRVSYSLGEIFNPNGDPVCRLDTNRKFGRNKKGYYCHGCKDKKEIHCIEPF